MKLWNIIRFIAEVASKKYVKTNRGYQSLIKCKNLDLCAEVISPQIAIPMNVKAPR